MVRKEKLEKLTLFNKSNSNVHTRLTIVPSGVNADEVTGTDGQLCQLRIEDSESREINELELGPRCSKTFYLGWFSNPSFSLAKIKLHSNWLKTKYSFELSNGWQLFVGDLLRNNKDKVFFKRLAMPCDCRSLLSHPQDGAHELFGNNSKRTSLRVNKCKEN